MSRKLCSLLLAAAALAWPAASQAAETSDPVTMTSTRVILKVGADRAVPVKASFQERPPMLTLTFPPNLVAGSLPERSTVAKGAVKSIVANYGPPVRRQGGSQRYIESVQLVLGGPYAYAIASEPGIITVDLTHPSTVSGASLEIGVKGGSIIAGINKRNKVSQRFRAMQDALARASSRVSWADFSAAPAPAQTAMTGPAAQGIDQPVPGPSGASRAEPSPSAAGAVPGALKPFRAAGRTRVAVPPAVLAGFAALSLVIAWGIYRFSPAGAKASRPASGVTRLPSGVVLIDQLVWRAFERQGYQLVQEQPLAPPLLGTLRVISKDGKASGLLFVGMAPFFEKQTVERFAQALREAKLEQGTLVASGSFTVPAQRAAKAYHIALIGRDHLAELLGSGAGSEYFTAQLQQTEARLDEAKELLRQHSAELETLRRQRNEASWYLGEERDRTARVEAQLGEMQQHIAGHQNEIARWQQEAERLRKQWEENEWYLGESRARVRHLEAQLAAMQETMQGHDGAAEAQRDHLKRQLEDEQGRNTLLQLQLADLQNRLEVSQQSEASFQQELERLKGEVSALQVFGDRRSQARATLPEAQVELYNGEEAPVFSGSVKDLSSGGMGLETDGELPGESPLRVRLTLPGREVIESKGRIMWQNRQGEPAKFRSGIRLLRLSSPVRAAIEQIVWEAQGTKPS